MKIYDRYSHKHVVLDSPDDTLSGANLAGAHLVDADLGMMTIREADLSGANLHGANLYHADLRGADLTDAVLIGTNLMGANLVNANLSGADLSTANLSGARLTNANLTGAGIIDADLSCADLSEANLTLAELHESDFTRASLFNANLSRIRHSWTQPAIIGEILRQAAGVNLERCALAAMILTYDDLKWDFWRHIGHPAGDWAGDVLGALAVVDPESPEWLRAR
jgi:uncharacterized protein YjbI with pentapeptide repeats